MDRERTCADRVEANLQGRIDDLRKLWDLYCEDCEASDDDIGNMYEYGLCFDYVPLGTFNDQTSAYFRYQISWGGPSDEFRFFVGCEYEIHRCEYWFLDWGDGASITLSGDDLELMKEIWEWFKEPGSVEHAYNKAMGIEEPKRG